VKKSIPILAAIVLVLALVLPAAALADQPPMGLRGLKGQAGVSNVAFVELWEKDSSSWEIVEDGAWGKLRYNLEGPTFDFAFNGHGLVPYTDYTLIHYKYWNSVTCLASGTANEEGDIRIAGSFDFGEGLVNAKIWLVPSARVNCGTNKLLGWHPTEYLYEYDVISYTYIGA